jgi:hypothetical protein
MQQVHEKQLLPAYYLIKLQSINKYLQTEVRLLNFLRGVIGKYIMESMEEEFSQRSYR